MNLHSRRSLLAAGLALAMPARAASCDMASADATWVKGALSAWDIIRREALKLPAGPRPRMILFDQTCRFEAPAGTVAPVWDGAAHGGQVKLPDGKTLPARVTAFAAPAEAGAEPFFTMALPSLWKAEGVTSALGLEALTEAVLIHEMTHTRQFSWVAPSLAALTRRFSLPDDLDDDSLQAAFKNSAAYVKAYEGERDLLFAAAVEPDLGKARIIAAQALTLVRERRARWFAGTDARWAPLDDLFTTMEGVGQWAGYQWLVSPKGRRLDPAFALNAFRRGGRSWTQDEGLALFLTIDKLLPRWQAAVFAATPTLGYGLLERAVRSPRRGTV